MLEEMLEGMLRSILKIWIAIEIFKTLLMIAVRLST